MYTIAHRVGRLVEIRIESPVSLEEAVRWGRDHNAVIDAVVGPYVCFVDLVDATVFPQNVVDAYVATMKSEPRLLRTGTLLSASPTLGMQIQRMIRAANNPDRKVFRDGPELEGWLGEILTPAERARLHELLADRAPPSAKPASSTRPAIGLPANDAAPGSTRATRRA
jgi:hypothetical protein